MMANFKKFGVAAAVASALGAAGAAQATTLGAPADALLVPFVIASTAKSGVVTNTLIGVTVADPNRANPGQFEDLSATTGAIGVGTLSPLATKYSAGAFPTGTPYCNTAGQLHWFFFDIDSNEVADGAIPVTCEDFVRIDWNYLVTGSPGFPSAADVPGYMVIADDRNGTSRASGLVLYGAAYQIKGDWKTEAFIPLVPMVDRADGAAGDEVTRSGSFVSNVNPVTAGILLPSPGTGASASNGVPAGVGNNTSRFSLRYVADPANTTFPTSTTMVLWFPDLGYGDKVRQRTNILVFNTEETAVSATVDIPHELNLVQVDPDGNPAKPSAPHTTVLRDGLRHTETDRAGVTAVGSAVNTGYVLFDVKDYYGSATVVVGGESITQANALTPVEGSRAGFAFSMISVSSSSNVQTELAHERGLVNRP